MPRALRGYRETGTNSGVRMAREHPIPELRSLPDDEAARLFSACLWRAWRYRVFWLGMFVASALDQAVLWLCANLPPGLLSDAVTTAAHVLYVHVFGFGFIWALRGAIRNRMAQERANEPRNEVRT